MSENNFSVNQHVPVGVPQREEKEVVGHTPQIHLENIDTYKVSVASLREKLIGLVKEGHMTEAVAERILSDFMYTGFNQVVKLKLE